MPARPPKRDSNQPEITSYATRTSMESTEASQDEHSRLVGQKIDEAMSSMSGERVLTVNNNGEGTGPQSSETATSDIPAPGKGSSDAGGNVNSVEDAVSGSRPPPAHTPGMSSTGETVVTRDASLDTSSSHPQAGPVSLTPNVSASDSQPAGISDRAGLTTDNNSSVKPSPSLIDKDTGDQTKPEPVMADEQPGVSKTQTFATPSGSKRNTDHLSPHDSDNKFLKEDDASFDLTDGSDNEEENTEVPSDLDAIIASAMEESTVVNEETEEPEETKEENSDKISITPTEQEGTKPTSTEKPHHHAASQSLDDCILNPSPEIPCAQGTPSIPLLEDADELLETVSVTRRVTVSFDTETQTDSLSIDVDISALKDELKQELLADINNKYIEIEDSLITSISTKLGLELNDKMHRLGKATFSKLYEKNKDQIMEAKTESGKNRARIDYIKDELDSAITGAKSNCLNNKENLSKQIDNITATTKQELNKSIQDVRESMDKNLQQVNNDITEIKNKQGILVHDKMETGQPQNQPSDITRLEAQLKQLKNEMEAGFKNIRIDFEMDIKTKNQDSNSATKQVTDQTLIEISERIEKVEIRTENLEIQDRENVIIVDGIVPEQDKSLAHSVRSQINSTMDIGIKEDEIVQCSYIGKKQADNKPRTIKVRLNDRRLKKSMMRKRDN